jgi:hypothetical protein
LERVADSLPVMPGEEGVWNADARRADALVALASARLASDADPDRSTVVVHASVEALAGGVGGCEIESGPAISPETATPGLQRPGPAVVEDSVGQVVHLGRMTREPSAWMLRQLKYRDSECTFPACGSKRFTQAHHVLWWEKGGTTDLDNLVLICSFHHRLVHEHGWSLIREQDGTVRWFLPDGTPYRAGPAPPLRRMERQPALGAVAL